MVRYAQALKRQLTSATSPSSRRTNTGALSRVHERSVGTRWHSTRSGATSIRAHMARMRPIVASSSTRIRMRSPGARCRMTSPYTQRTASSLPAPGQSVRSCGHASQVAACGSHSAGMR
jgi:hypothetical protein